MEELLQLCRELLSELCIQRSRLDQKATSFEDAIKATKLKIRALKTIEKYEVASKKRMESIE